MPYIVDRVCSLCREKYGEKEIEHDPEGRVTHGMCPSCGPKWRAEQMKEVEQMLKEGGGADV